MGNKTNKNSKPNAPKKSSASKVLLRFLAIILGLSLGCFLYLYQMLGGFTFVNTTIMSEEDYSTLDLSDLDGSLTGGDVSSSWADGGHTAVYFDPSHPIIEVSQKDKNVENILVFGIDSRSTSEVVARSDAMMIVSIDKEANTVKLISLMRDIGVYIGDTDETSSNSLDKLAHAYAYGGVGLMINTINRNFDLDIQRFVMLDFNSAADVIDLCGGVNIEVQDAEVKYANINITEQNNVSGGTAPLLTSGGMQTLSGIQAIGWSRIRYLDSDFVRTSRQRTVATALMNKVSSMNTISQLAMVEDSAGMFETNMRQADLIRIGLNAIGGVGSMSEYRVPEDNLYSVQQNPWMMVIDWNAQLPALHNYIWGE